MGGEAHGHPKERVTTTRSKRAQCPLGSENQSVKHESRMQRSREVARASMQPCGRSASAAPAPSCPQWRCVAKVVGAPATRSPAPPLWFAGSAGGSGTRSWLHAQDGPQLHWAKARPEGTAEQQPGRTLSRRRQHALLPCLSAIKRQHVLRQAADFPVSVRSPHFCETLSGRHPQAGLGGIGNASAQAARHAAILEIRCCKSVAITVRLHSIRAARFHPCRAYYRQYLLAKLGRSSFC